MKVGCGRLSLSLATLPLLSNTLGLPGSAESFCNLVRMPSSWSTNANEVVIGVVGVTGSGKSSFIKRVTQRNDIRTSTDTESGKSEPFHVIRMEITILIPVIFFKSHKR